MSGQNNKNVRLTNELERMCCCCRWCQKQEGVTSLRSSLFFFLLFNSFTTCQSYKTQNTEKLHKKDFYVVTLTHQLSIVNQQNIFCKFYRIGPSLCRILEFVLAEAALGLFRAPRLRTTVLYI